MIWGGAVDGSNQAGGYQGRVQITSNDGQATLPIDYTFKGAIDAGTHLFTATLVSPGSQTILATDARAHEDGTELKIVRGPEEVDRVFRLTGIGDRLDIVDEFSGR